MKKFIATLLALLLAMTTLTAFAEDVGEALPESVLLGGFVLGATDESILLLTDDGMTVQANLTEETFLTADVTVGDHIIVTYNGMMTRSLPAQVTAEMIANNKLEGIVSELTEEGFLLTVGEQTFQVNASAEKLAGIQDGMTVTVFFDGKMTRSIPAQITADHVRGQAITGVVTEMTEHGFTLSVEGSDVVYTVIPKEDVLSFVTAEPGMIVTVITDGVMTMSLDPIVNAVELLPAPVVQELFDLSGTVTEINDEYLLILGADGQEYQVNLLPETFFEGKEIAIGDFIHVTYNGQMTFSLPAQVAALKIGCYVHQGVVSELSDGVFMLTNDADGMIAVVFEAGMADNIKDGQVVAVYTNGAMTMSLPAQVGAELIVVLSK